MKDQVHLLYGTGGGHFNPDNNPTPSSITALLDELQSLGIKHIDTAAVYPSAQPGLSETLLGQVKASERFTIDTKIMVKPHGVGSADGELTRDSIRASVQTSLERLGVSSVNCLYAHRPDPHTSLEETAGAFSEVVKEGKAKMWGISNYTAEDTAKLLSICEKNGYVKPAIFQGMYNAICRFPEADLFPVLREHGVAFTCYSPTAGGFLSGVLTTGSGAAGPSRYQGARGAHWKSLYDKPEIHDALRVLIRKCEERGMGLMEGCLRWLAWHSGLKGLSEGSGIILGASRAGQMEENVGAVEKGELDKELAEAFEVMWKDVEGSAPKGLI
ncbi:Aldo/keto reductase [Aulographum hederae CBS 113979]|uniref:Aldo/keto reductase n=1 Tax=Aulographum hederae CBS 113979 TaxID=1176131 RepID=A0A6G1H7H8_9PEZI|nr:Aldo/keto reductase [Aulographum hederae CBS 113979]